MTVRQLFNEVDDIQGDIIIQQYDYEKNDYAFRIYQYELQSKSDEYNRIIDSRVKYMFNSVFGTREPVLIIEVEAEE